MNRAETLYEFASHLLPGGVCASARANAAIGHPFYVSRGDGAMLYDLDGRAYMDLCTSHLCVLGKAFGGGMPISALAGSRTVMQHLKPLGNSQMSGTYLAHPTGVAAALATLEVYSAPGFYEHLDRVGQHFYAGFQRLIDASGVVLRLQFQGPRFGLYFGVREPVTHYRQAALRDHAAETVFIRGCFERGVFFQPSAHHGFSAAHTIEHMDQVRLAIEGALSDVRRAQAGA